ncbi:MAG TPA: NAD(P)H-binding protein, partial [Nocardioides sp.]|nr:NAD(P)H-binding protein [Nocardioides sp.]
VWSAGAGGGDPARTVAVDRDAAIRSMDAAQTAGVGRYVMVSFSGANSDSLVPEDNPFRSYQDAKIAADEHLRSSGLDWTILGPGSLTLEPGRGSVNPDARSGEGDTTSRELVAQVALAVLDDPRAHHQTLVFGDGDVPIEDWLASL